jgi:hypothetical protein
MTELTEYLIELGKMLDIDTDTEGCVNPNLALSARIVLAIGELRQPLQWKDVADGLPEVEGQYSVVKGSGKTPFYLTFPKAEDKSAYAQIVRMMWAEEIAAYIPVPIPEWKEQR